MVGTDRDPGDLTDAIAVCAPGDEPDDIAPYLGNRAPLMVNLLRNLSDTVVVEPVRRARATVNTATKSSDVIGRSSPASAIGPEWYTSVRRAERDRSVVRFSTTARSHPATCQNASKWLCRNASAPAQITHYPKPYRALRSTPNRQGGLVGALIVVDGCHQRLESTVG